MLRTRAPPAAALAVGRSGNAVAVVAVDHSDSIDGAAAASRTKGMYRTAAVLGLDMYDHVGLLAVDTAAGQIAADAVAADRFGVVPHVAVVLGMGAGFRQPALHADSNDGQA